MNAFARRQMTSRWDFQVSLPYLHAKKDVIANLLFTEVEVARLHSSWDISWTKVKRGEIRWALIRKTFILEAVVYCDFHLSTKSDFFHASKPSATRKSSTFQQTCLAILNQGGTSCALKCRQSQLRTVGLKYEGVSMSPSVILQWSYLLTWVLHILTRIKKH